MGKKESFCKLLWGWTQSRAAEVSTWRGVVMATAAAVVAVAPELAVKVGTLAASIVGVLDVFTNESKPKI